MTMMERIRAYHAVLAVYLGGEWDLVNALLGYAVAAILCCASSRRSAPTRWSCWLLAMSAIRSRPNGVSRGSCCVSTRDGRRGAVLERNQAGRLKATSLQRKLQGRPS